MNWFDSFGVLVQRLSSKVEERIMQNERIFVFGRE